MIIAKNKFWKVYLGDNSKNWSREGGGGGHKKKKKNWSRKRGGGHIKHWDWKRKHYSFKYGGTCISQL